MLLRRSPLALCLFLTSVLCGCAQAPDAPEGSAELASTAAVSGALISDQQHSAGTHGFFFRPPMVPNVPFGGPLDTGLPVVVKIDEINLAGTTLASIATFTTTSGPGGVRVVTEDEHYSVQWHTDLFGLSATKIYRIRVSVEGRELGFADVDVVNGGRDLKNVATNEYIPLLNGRTLPIKFRIEEGVVDGGGTDTDGDGVSDDDDNCPTTANANQLDTNGDGQGDACECQGVVCSAADQCHDAGVCQSTTGACGNPEKPAGSACNDGNGDTVNDVCTSGSCAGVDLCAGVTCAASDQCHVAGTCDHATGECSDPAATNGTSCNDGNGDTVNDICTAGSCAGVDLCAGVTCAASDQCHVAGTCNHATGACSDPAAANGTSCNDGNGDTVNDVCTSGSCAGVDLCAGVTCAASDQCHVAGTCSHATGACSDPAAANGTSCNDGNGDTVNDICTAGSCAGVDLCAGVTCAASDQCHVAGTCDHATGECSDPAATNGTSCNDGNGDTVNDICTAGSCAGVDLCAGVTCAASDQCHVAGTCDHATGLCSNPAASDGTSCSDGNACTQSDSCDAGVCLGANPVVCTAQDQCHEAGVCNPSSGVCSNPEADSGTSCNDGDACTQTDACDGGLCVGANPVTCTALDQCHDAGSCDSDTGLCSTPAKDFGTLCDDGNACTQSDTCIAGSCEGSNPVVCSASDQCHDAGTCDTQTGTCSNPDKLGGSACSDGNACTQDDTCEAGACVGDDPVVCSAQDQCHVAGVCDGATGTCSNPARANGVACSDGNGCTAVDTCQAGSCGGSGAVCYPSVACTDDPAESNAFSCGACPTGYVGNGISCTDFNACAASPCFPGVTCTDQPAPSTSFTCGACPVGYRGDGITCTIIPGCESNPCLPTTTCTDLTPPAYSCSLCVGPSCPTLAAQAGPDRSGVTGSTVMLLGGATGNNGAITCRWTNSANATVLNTCAIGVIASGSITYTLQVTDASGRTATDSAIVSALPVVANAGPDKNITAGQSTQIVGSFSGASCGNASCIQCQWTLTGGTVVANTCTTSVAPTVTTQYFLRVTDTGSGAIATDSMSVFVTDTKAHLCGWNVVMYRQNSYPSSGTPNYVCDATGQARVQKVNGNPAIVLSDLVVGNTKIVGHIGVLNDPTGDDDLIGFVWGWQNPLHHYWLGWKQSSQNLGGNCGNALSGISVKKVDVPTGATTITTTLLGFPATDYTFRCGLTWSTDKTQTTLNDPGTVFLKSPNDAGGFTTGWVDNRWYRFEFYYTATQTKVFVYWDQDKIAQPSDPLVHSFTVQDSSYPEGKFAFFSNSQAEVNFGDFTLASLDAYTANAGADVSVPAGTPTALTGTAMLAVPPYACEWQANGSTFATGCSTTVSPLVSTTYELAVIDAFGRVAIDEVTITVP